MDEQQAAVVAEALGGETWQSGGDIWLVLLHRSDGRVVAMSEDVVCEYADDDALESGQASISIVLR